jgi:hypothetical protein
MSCAEFSHIGADVGQHGVVGASTPFVTGRPFTLLDSASIHSDGAVGFALCHDEPLTQPVDRPRVAYNGLTPLGRPLTVTECDRTPFAVKLS